MVRTNTNVIQVWCTSRVAVHWPLATSHNRAVLSYEPVANVFPSALNVTLLTLPECPLRTQHYDYGSCSSKGQVQRERYSISQSEGLRFK